MATLGKTLLWTALLLLTLNKPARAVRDLLQAGTNRTLVPFVFDETSAPAQVVPIAGPVIPSIQLVAPSPNQAVSPTGVPALAPSLVHAAPQPAPSVLPSSVPHVAPVPAPVAAVAPFVAPAPFKGPAPGPGIAPRIAPAALPQPPPAPGVIGLPFLGHACGQKQDCLNFAVNGVYYSTDPKDFRQLNRNDLEKVDCQCIPGAYELTYCGPWASICCAVQNTDGLCKKDVDCCGGYLCRSGQCIDCRTLGSESYSCRSGVVA